MLAGKPNLLTKRLTRTFKSQDGGINKTEKSKKTENAEEPVKDGAEIKAGKVSSNLHGFSLQVENPNTTFIM